MYSQTEQEEILKKNEQNTKLDGWMVMKFDSETEHRK